MKFSFALAAPLLLALAAPTAAATTLDISQGGIFGGHNVTIKNRPAGGNITVIAGAMHMTGIAQPSGASADFWAFCVDLAHTVSLGVNKMSAVNYSYTTTSTPENGYGTAYSNDQLAQMGGLAARGFDLIADAGGAINSSLGLELAATQLAIWKTGYTDISFSGASNALLNRTNQLLALAPSLSGTGTHLLSLDTPQAQGLLTSLPAGAVPEPATWVMLIAGFGLVGLAARRQRKQTAPMTN